MRVSLRTICAVVLFPLTACSTLGRTESAAAILMNPAHPGMNAAAPASYQIRFETTKGPIVMEVTREWAPRGADRLYNLARRGFYDGAAFYRVVPGFVVQFGLPADPALGAVWRDLPIEDDPVRESNRRGYVSYATSGPDSRTVQLFINLADNSPLDLQGFAPVGRIVEGMEVVDSLYAGYGDGGLFSAGPDQTRLALEGSAYLEQAFPLLDRIISARVLE